MFAPPKSSGRPKPLVARSQSSSSASGLRKPSVNSNLGRAPSAAQQRQASQSSLLAAGKSTSRSSILSDTTASVCSSLAASTSGQVKVRIPAAATATAAGGQSSAGSTTTRIGISGRKTGPASTAPTSTRRVASSASSTTSGSSSGGGSAALKSLPRQLNPHKVPTVAMSLRDKDNQIKLLIKERDEQKFQAELMARRAEEWEDKFQQSELEKSHVTSEADDEVVELRRLAQEFEDENKRLAGRLADRDQVIGDTQFKLDELEIERAELKRELEDREQLLRSMESERQELAAGKAPAAISSERAISKAKYEREIEELKEKVVARDEQMMQLRSSLEMRKNEVANLQQHAADLERKLKIESERSERHLKRIDEVNLELKAADAKLATKSEENDMHEKQVRSLRQELRSAEERLEQISLARKKDVDVLHNKLAAARRGSTTPTSPVPYKTPTPQDEIVRLQMEIRDLRDQLIDREAELDCGRRDMEVLRRKMETRTLEVDCNNQELARRCQDLLEQNRQSEETVKQLLKSTTEHSAQLVRATEDLKEANGKCVRLREELAELELKFEQELKRAMELASENNQLRDENDEHQERVALLRQQVDALNEQLGELCHQLDVQTATLHKDREALADQLSQSEIDSAQLRQELATARQDLRSGKLQTQEVASERDRLKSDLDMKEKYIRSRNDIIETLRHELDDCKKSLAEHKVRIDELRLSSQQQLETTAKDSGARLEALRRECQLRTDELSTMKGQCELLQRQLDEQRAHFEEEQLSGLDEMRQKHSAELDELRLRLRELEAQLEEAKATATLRRATGEKAKTRSQVTFSSETLDNEKQPSGSGESESKSMRQEYETQIEFLNSLVVDMQKKCDDYRGRLSQLETANLMQEFDNLILAAPKAAPAPLRSAKQQSPPVKTTSSLMSTASSASDSTTSSANSSATLRRHQESTNLASVTATLTRRTRNEKLERPARISGRPYCDICQVYDLHHTVYCPNVTEKLAARSANTDNNNSPGTRNNNNNSTNYSNDDIDFEDIFRQSLDSLAIQQFASLRRPAKPSPRPVDFQRLTGRTAPPPPPPPPRPYCDQCDLFGHTVKSCGSLRA